MGLAAMDGNGTLYNHVCPVNAAMEEKEKKGTMTDQQSPMTSFSILEKS